MISGVGTHATWMKLFTHDRTLRHHRRLDRRKGVCRANTWPSPLGLPGYLCYGQLKLLPYWDPLPGDPRFEKIVDSFAPSSASLSLQKGVPRRTILGSVQALAEFILSELRSATYCPVYEEQLIRLWPIDDTEREAKIRSFAEERGFRLRFYCEGQCAVFDKQRSTRV